jgi:uncharacterized membrane protein
MKKAKPRYLSPLGLFALNLFLIAAFTGLLAVAWIMTGTL